MCNGETVRLKIFRCLCLLLSLFAVNGYGQEFDIISGHPAKPLSEVRRTILSVYASLGIDAQIVFVPPRRALVESAQKPWVDAVMLRVAEFSLLNSDYIRIDVPVWDARMELVLPVGDNNRYDWDNLNQLKSLRLGALRGIIAIEQRLSRTGVIYLDKVNQGIEMVASGKLDAFVTPNLTDGKMILPDTTKLSRVPLSQEPVYHFIHKRHEELAKSITAEFLKLTDAGVLPLQ